MAEHTYRRMHLRKRDSKRERKSLADKRRGHDRRQQPKLLRWAVG